MLDYLPANLLNDILCRLPVESLLRCRCVSKEWYSLISSPDFISIHLSYSLSATYLHAQPDRHEYYHIYLDENQLTHVKELNFPFTARSGNQLSIVGFCNGLFCLYDNILGDTYTIIVWNPAIRKKVSLHMPRGSYVYCLGFGFDPKTQDLKVVRITYLQGTYTASQVEVYSLSTGLWEAANVKDIHHKPVEYSSSSTRFCLNGTMHWLSSSYENVGGNVGGKYSNSLLLFNLSDETFCEMGLPRRLFHEFPLSLSVTLCGEQVCVIWSDSNHCPRYCFWVMNQYGKLDSWMEKFVVVVERAIPYAIGFRENSEFLFEKSGGGLLSYDPESKEFKDVDIPSERIAFLSSKYFESLVLLDQSTAA